MVVCKDAHAVSLMRKWATQAREPAVEYLHREMGYNYRMSNVLAAIGRGQLRVLDERVAQRRAVFERYAAALRGIPGLRFQEEAAWGRHTRWLTVAYLDPAETIGAGALIERLSLRNIEARPVWRPMHTQPLFAQATSIGGAVSEMLYRTGVCLPSSSSLGDGAQQRVITAVREALAR